MRVRRIDEVRHTRSGAFPAVGLACVVFVLVAAVAAPVVAAEVAAPLVTPTDMSAQLWPSESVDGTGPVAVLVVGARVATSVPLPCRVRLPLPKGATVSWVGELTGQGVENDIPQQPVTVKAAGGEAIEVTLTTYRDAQYEADVSAPVKEGDRYVAHLDWVQTAPASLLLMGAMLREQATDAEITPAPEGAPQVQGGDQLYLLPQRKAPVGTKVPLEVSFVFDTSVPELTAGTPVSETTTIVLAVVGAALVAAVIALVVMMRRTSRGTRG
jgi:hypothetical protein